MTWDYVLAEKLKKFVAEVAEMPNAEWETWQQYLRVKSVLTDLHIRTEQHRGQH